MVEWVRKRRNDPALFLFMGADMASSGKQNSEKNSRTGRTEQSAGNDVERRVTTALLKVGAQIEGEKFKATIADYIRLLQMYQGMQEQQGPHEVRVQWLDTLTME